MYRHLNTTMLYYRELVPSEALICLGAWAKLACHDSWSAKTVISPPEKRKGLLLGSTSREILERAFATGETVLSAGYDRTMRRTRHPTPPTTC